MIARSKRSQLRWAWVVASAVCTPTAAGAQSPPAAKGFPRVPIGMSNLIVRLDSSDDIGLAGQKLRVQVLEHLRSKGVEAVGAENLVFEKDDTKKARFMLGGTINDLACWAPSQLMNCRLGVEWQVLDVATDTVVYRVVTRSSILGVSTSEKERIGRSLVLSSVDSLLRRPNFRAVLAAGEGAPPIATDATLPSAGFATCGAQPRKMPEGAEDLLGGTVLVKTPTGHGSGFFLTSDGLVLTAAHVVERGPLKIRLRDGAEVDAVVVRTAPRADVALLRPALSMVGQRCVPVGTIEPPVGADAYVAGAPADARLAFSLTRGIISGVRQLDGRPQLQTDAPVSPGNSGGPLADASGAVAAVVVSKLSGGRVEGVSFAVPVQRALSVLSLVPAAKTDPSLLTASLQTPSASAKKGPIIDPADAVPTLDPVGDAQRADAQRETERDAERDAATPEHAKPLVYGGIAVGLYGLYNVYAGWDANNDPMTTRSDFKKHRMQNALGWVEVAAGSGMIIWGRSLYPKASKGRSSRLDLVVTPSRLSVRGAFW